MLDRVYCPGPIVEGRAAVVDDEARHLARVRRAAVGDAVEVFDGRGQAFRAEVASIGRDRVELRITSGPLGDRRPACSLTLATAVPKGDRFDWLVEKATELGVARLVPIVSARSVVEPRSAKMERLRRVIVEAAKQCGRNRLMDLDGPTPWADVSACVRCPRLIAEPGGPGFAGGGSPAEVCLAIGPEGGFTPEEVEAAYAAGWAALGLGATILRVETAGIVGCAAILAGDRG